MRDADMDPDDAETSDSKPAPPPSPSDAGASQGAPIPAAPPVGAGPTQTIQNLVWMLLPYLSLLTGAGLLAFGFYRCRAPNISVMRFSCHLLYLKGGSSAYVDSLGPHSDLPVLVASFALTGLLLGLGILLLKRDFSLRMLLVVVLVPAGLGIVPAFIEKLPPGFAVLDAKFGKRLDAQQAADLERRLQAGQLAGHKLAGSTAGAENAADRNIKRLAFDLNVSTDAVRWLIFFPQDLPVGQDRELTDYGAQYFEDVTTEVAQELGLPAVTKRDRIAR